MILCDDDHEEICYASRDCPLCLLIKERDRALRNIERLEEEVDELKDNLAGFEERSTE